MSPCTGKFLIRARDCDVLTNYFCPMMPFRSRSVIFLKTYHNVRRKVSFNKYNSVCVYSNSRNDVPRVAQRYGTIAAHSHRRRSVTLQSPTATLIPLFSSSELTGCGYPGLLDRKNRSDMCPRWESNPRLPACKATTLSTRPGSPLQIIQI